MNLQNVRGKECDNVHRMLPRRYRRMYDVTSGYKMYALENKVIIVLWPLVVAISLATRVGPRIP